MEGQRLRKRGCCHEGRPCSRGRGQRHCLVSAHHAASFIGDVHGHLCVGGIHHTQPGLPGDAVRDARRDEAMLRLSGVENRVPPSWIATAISYTCPVSSRKGMPGAASSRKPSVVECSVMVRFSHATAKQPDHIPGVRDDQPPLKSGRSDADTCTTRYTLRRHAHTE
jgi:hypothetical protein